MDSRRAKAAGLRGTRCSRPLFILCAGTVEVRDPESISGHVARRTSPDLAAVRMANSSARAADPSCLRREFMKLLASDTGSAAWCLGFATLFRAGSCVSRCPRQRAGFRPSRSCRSCRLSAQARISSIRPRTRDAVSVFARQIGSSTSSTCADSTSPTSSWPIFGRRRDAANCSTAKRVWRSSSPLPPGGVQESPSA